MVTRAELSANLGWGDADGKTLYLTARTGLYWIRLNIAGVRRQPIRIGLSPREIV